MRLVQQYFPEFSKQQIRLLEEFAKLFIDWNNKINMVSRKDSHMLEERHILHSLAIAKFIQFEKDSFVADIGTGGGFPGIPLAIAFPDVQFVLIDSIRKKINVVDDIKNSLNLENVIPICNRIENINDKYDFVVSRAVTAFPKFVTLVHKKFRKNNFNSIPNGIIYLKGGDINEEITGLKSVTVKFINEYFEEDFFETKKIIYYPQ